MTRSHVRQLAMRATTLGALLAGFAAVAPAQKPKGPPIDTRGMEKSNARANKGQATAQAERMAAREDKADRASEKSDDRAHRAAWKAGRDERKAEMRGMKLTGQERKSYDAVRRRHDHERRELQKEWNASVKAGHRDPTLGEKIDAMRTRQRDELRDVLTPAQQVRFDKNLAAFGSLIPRP